MNPKLNYEQVMVANITEHYQSIYASLMELLNHEPIASTKADLYMTAAISKSLIRDWGICSEYSYALGLDISEIRLVENLSHTCARIGADLIRSPVLCDIDAYTEINVSRPGVMVLAWR